MKFNVSSKALYNVASSVSKVINSKNALTILENFLIRLEDDGILTITGSDQENALTARLSTDSHDGAGSFCLGARRMVEMLKELPEQGIEISVDESSLEVNVKYQSGHFTMVGLPADQYPLFRAEPGEQAVKFSVPTEQFIQGLDNTMFAVSTDEYRQNLMGVLIDIKEDGIIYVATDTRKLVRYTDHRTKPGLEAHFVIPSKPSVIIKNVFAKEEVLSFTMTSRAAIIESENLCFHCTFLNGNYPDYNRVFPKSNTNVLTIDRVAFLNAVRRVGLFVEMDGGLEKFRITSDSIMIKTADPSMCTSAREKVPCSYSGTDLTIGFAASYLLEILNTLDSPDVIVNLGDAARPGIFRPSEETEETELVMLLMPMTVTDF